MRRLFIITLIALSVCGCGKKPNVLEPVPHAEKNYAYPEDSQPSGQK